MSTELDALIDRIRQQLAEQRRRPTVEEAELVGRLALCHAGDETTKQRGRLARGGDDGGGGGLAASAAPRSVTSLDDELKERLQQLRVLKKDVSEHAARAVRGLCSDVLSGLRTRYPHSFNWRLANSGSYFDKTKVASS